MQKRQKSRKSKQEKSELEAINKAKSQGIKKDTQKCLKANLAQFRVEKVSISW